MDMVGEADLSGKAVGATESRATVLKPLSPSQLVAASKLATSLEYMRTHLHESISIPTLCAISGYSQSRFFDLFKSATGESPLNWFIRARMRWAAELMESPGVPIKQIAWQVGYRDQFYFSRVFKSVYGVSPTEYRAQQFSAKRNGASGVTAPLPPTQAPDANRQPRPIPVTRR
jgi:AraC-like DNA-binding protein